jgi:hypothetical protein
MNWATAGTTKAEANWTGGRDPEQARRFVTPAGSFEACFADLRDRGLHAPVERQARLGGERSARRPTHQLHADAPLKRNQRAIDRLQRPTEATRRRCLTARVDDRDKGLDVLHRGASILAKFGRIYRAETSDYPEVGHTGARRPRGEESG